MIQQLISAFTANAFANAFISVFTSVYAIIFYCIIFLGITIALVISLVKKESKSSDAASAAQNSPQNLEAFSEKVESTAVKTNGSRFFMLSKIDENALSFRHKDYNDKISLKDFCDNFRNFAANKLKLYYDISDVRKFVAGLGVSHIIIIQGISGTGKTSLAYAFGEFMENPTSVIPIQPMWKERNDLIGYYNEFTKKYNETTFLQKLYEANYSKNIYITLLDEMNIARIEYYFAEFLSLLEIPNPEKRYVDVVTDKWKTDPLLLKNGQVKLADNMWFIGTANNDDTTFSISDKVYDRAMILDLDFKTDVFVAPETNPVHLSAERFSELMQEALKEYQLTKRNLKRLDALDKYLIQNFHITFGNRIRKQIMTYIPLYLSCGGDEIEALDDIIAKKLMRKLETQNPVYLRNTADDFLAFLDDLFGQDKMIQCKTRINRLIKNA